MVVVDGALSRGGSIPLFLFRNKKPCPSIFYPLSPNLVKINFPFFKGYLQQKRHSCKDKPLHPSEKKYLIKDGNAFNYFKVLYTKRKIIRIFTNF
jgi:hypothetical protein